MQVVFVCNSGTGAKMVGQGEGRSQGHVFANFSK